MKTTGDRTMKNNLLLTFRRNEHEHHIGFGTDRGSLAAEQGENGGGVLSWHDIYGGLHSTIHLPSCRLRRRRGHGGQHPVARIGLSTWVRRLLGRIGVPDHDDLAYV